MRIIYFKKKHRHAQKLTKFKQPDIIKNGSKSMSPPVWLSQKPKKTEINKVHQKFNKKQKTKVQTKKNKTN